MKKSHVRKCIAFDNFTRDLFGLSKNVNLTDWEEKCISIPKVRRGSVTLSERLFYTLISDHCVLEVGGNVGRHSKIFLDIDTHSVHTFEPNTELLSNFEALQQSKRFVLNPFALSNENGLATFNIVDEVDGIRKGATHGMGSLEEVEDSYKKIYGGATVRKKAVSTVKGSTYIEKIFGQELPQLALWIDVEGHCLQVLTGFGRYLENVNVAICELETDTRYISQPNADAIFELMAENGLVPIWRDMQYYGRFNVIFVKRNLAEQAVIARETVTGPFIGQVATLAQ